MFCPQCGQQQASDEIRFCPRCGLSLLPHAALLSVGNATADPNESAAPARAGKRLRSRRAAKLMFFSVAMLPVFIVLCVAADAGEPLLIPFMTFMAGLAWWVYVRLFADDVAHAARQTPRRDSESGGEKPALGAPQFVPASSFNSQRANTAEMVRPPSVTENTTTLLGKDV